MLACVLSLNVLVPTANKNLLTAESCKDAHSAKNRKLDIFFM